MSVLATQYGVEVGSASWKTFSTPKSCEIRHEIPGYGLARFAYSNRGVLLMRIESHAAVSPSEGGAILKRTSPPWRIDGLADEWFDVPLLPGHRPLEIDGPNARWALESIAAGYQIRLQYRPKSSAEPVVVLLSPINFQQPFSEYSRCIEQLEPPHYTAAEAGFGRIQFARNSARLDAQAVEQVRRLASYLREHPNIKQVQLTGHADSRGGRRYNMRLSQKRSAAVAAQLKRLGVAAERIVTRHVGEAQPLARGRSEKRRAQNRRVELKFIY